MAADVRLERWSELADIGWPTLLIGNGASMNVWSGFGYRSLYDNAELSDPARVVLEEVSGRNFEAALEYIHHARVVNSALQIPADDKVRSLYDEVKTGLFAAVGEAHVPYERVTEDRKTRIATEIRAHRSVYTTNYDLIPYWSLMSDPGRFLSGFTDQFTGLDVTFEPSNASAATTFYYLHGGIHLWQDDYGTVGKWTSGLGGNLLQLAGRYEQGSSRQPLFVSEGDSLEKLRSILRSNYLRHCAQSLAADEQNTVVFGHALSEHADGHIASALHEGGGKVIAFSILPGDPLREVQVARLRSDFGDAHELHFFDSTTHPLGDPTLRVPELASGPHDWARLLEQAEEAGPVEDSGC